MKPPTSSATTIYYSTPYCLIQLFDCHSNNRSQYFKNIHKSYIARDFPIQGHSLGYHIWGAITCTCQIGHNCLSMSLRLYILQPHIGTNNRDYHSLIIRVTVYLPVLKLQWMHMYILVMHTVILFSHCIMVWLCHWAYCIRKVGDT